MLKSDFIFQLALLEAIPNTKEMAPKERANIIRCRVKGSSLFNSIEDEYNKLQNATGISTPEEIVKHNQDLVNFRKALVKDTVDFEPIKLSEETFEALCSIIVKPVTLDLVLDTKEISEDDFLGYVYSTFVN